MTQTLQSFCVCLCMGFLIILPHHDRVPNVHVSFQEGTSFEDYVVLEFRGGNPSSLFSGPPTLNSSRSPNCLQSKFGTLISIAGVTQTSQLKKSLGICTKKF
jgi:hypothetical protein